MSDFELPFKNGSLPDEVFWHGRTMHTHGMDAAASGVSARLDTGVACQVMLVRFHQVVASAEQMGCAFGSPDQAFATAELLLAARKLGLKIKTAQTSVASLEQTPLPAIALDPDGEFFILVCLGQGKVLIHALKSLRPQAIRLDVLETHWVGTFILVRSRASTTGESSSLDLAEFIPAIVKYRKLLGEVLLVSFVMQLFPLVTPLFFLAVMNNVLIHHGLTTLDVIVIGLVGIMLFEPLLSGLRSHVFAHIARRIDVNVNLGSRLFRQLITSPLDYFQARRIGDSVTRARELKSICSFPNGNAITVVLNLLFLIKFRF